MNEQLQPILDISSASRRRGRAIRLTLAVVGIGVLLSASLFLLGGGWSKAPASGAAAQEQGEANIRTVTPTARPAQTPNAAATSEAYVAQLVWIAASLQPAPTFAPVPTATQPSYQPRNAPPASQPATPAPVVVVSQPPAASCPTQGMSGFALDLFNSINSARAQNGMGALAADSCVTYVAQIRSDDMASLGYFAHVSPDGSSAFSLLDAYGVPNGWAGENLARNNYPPAETVAVAIRDLMASPAHRDNILGPNYTSMGVAVTLDGTGIYYYTMVFTGPA